MRLFTTFPLLLLPIAIYNLVAFTTIPSSTAAQQCSAAFGRTVHPLS